MITLISYGRSLAQGLLHSDDSVQLISDRFKKESYFKSVAQSLWSRRYSLAGDCLLATGFAAYNAHAILSFLTGAGVLLGKIYALQTFLILQGLSNVYWAFALKCAIFVVPSTVVVFTAALLVVGLAYLFKSCWEKIGKDDDDFEDSEVNKFTKENVVIVDKEKNQKARDPVIDLKSSFLNKREIVVDIPVAQQTLVPRDSDQGVVSEKRQNSELGNFPVGKNQPTRDPVIDLESSFYNSREIVVEQVVPEAQRTLVSGDLDQPVVSEEIQNSELSNLNKATQPQQKNYVINSDIEHNVLDDRRKAEQNNQSSFKSVFDKGSELLNQGLNAVLSPRIYVDPSLLNNTAISSLNKDQDNDQNALGNSEKVDDQIDDPQVSLLPSEIEIV